MHVYMHILHMNEIVVIVMNQSYIVIIYFYLLQKIIISQSL